MSAPQKVLLPTDNIADGAEWSPSGPIPSSLRTFGKYPNVDEWLPGDLLLVFSTDPVFTTREIVATQERLGFSKEDARWQHAAVHLGDGYVMEATLPGIRYVPIYEYLGAHGLRLRRPIDLTDKQRWEIAIQAAVRANQRYAIRNVLQIYKDSRIKLWRPRSLITPFARTKSAICSQLYSDAFSFVTSKLLTRTVAEVITPAALSASIHFEDVDLKWSLIL